jgi:glucan phosphoethanolaminetransferase (alkaline phosphatase superfamily)
MKDTHEKYLIFHRMRTKHSVNLTEEQVELIDDIYKKRELENLKNLADYRFVNALLSVFMVLVFVLLENYSLRWWFAALLTLIFFLINVYYLFYNTYKMVIFKRNHGIKNEE